jgi:hypothetical protein
MERDALRDDVDQWRTRCRGLEDKLEAERRETTLLRERVRKLSDRILEQSAAHAAIPSPTEDAQSRLVADMRNQLFSFASALEREQKEKADALAQIAELQALLDSFKTPQIAAESLPATPKSRPRATLPASVSEDLSHFADADDAELEPVPEAAAFSDNPEDPNFTRMRGFSFPSGPVEPTDAQSKRHSFFNLSRARPVRAPKASGSGLGLDWPMQAQDDRLHDLPPIVVDDTNRSLITPVSPSRTAFNATTGRVVSEPLRNKPQTHQTSERQIPTSSSTGSFALSFLSGYLTIPRSAPIPAPPPGPQLPIPRISVTPSSVSPKKSLLHLERDVFNARVGSVAYGCEVNFRHCCNRCTGDIIEL